MLPFDLHVLGLPPAFTLSQDQTLHLSFSASAPKGFVQCFECSRRPSQIYSLHLHALNRLGSVSNVCKMDSFHLPDVRTSYLRTLSKIFGTGLSAASRFAPLCKVPEGAAHHTALFRYVNTL